MKLSEFIKTLQRIHESNLGEDEEVVIKVRGARTSVGPSRTTIVTGAHSGFDWDKGTVFLSTEDEVYIELEELKKRSRVLEEITGWLSIMKAGGLSNRKKTSSKDFLGYVKDKVLGLYPHMKDRL
jgi:hypothetical protein